ncbi:MAG: hypothetical protein IJS20_00370 [Bacteroidales bacterium]|nr:hypothetical protein [Bacteroidales bacterium]
MRNTIAHPYSIQATLQQVRRVWLIVLTLCCLLPAQARKRTPADWVDTGDAQLDSIILQLNRKSEWLINQGIGKLDIYTNIQGYSHSENKRWWTPLLRDILPFDSRTNDTTFFSATCKTGYQTPCELLISPLSITSDNRRRTRRILQQLYPILYPTYAIRIMRDKGDDKDYILPFSNDGLRQYQFVATDTTIQERDTLLTIHFWPRKTHHDLLEGDAIVHTRLAIPLELHVNCKIDFGEATDTIRFEVVDDMSRIKSCTVDFYYKFGKMRGHNHYDYSLDIKQLLPKVAFDPKLENLNLTEIYQSRMDQFTNTARPKSDTLSAPAPPRRRSFFQKLPQFMVSTTDIDAFGTDVRIYGPLNPASFGYDKINGITLRSRLRFSHQFNNDQSIRILPEVGYACRLQEFRYKFITEWNYCPTRRGTLLLRLQNGANGFSSRFKDDVNRTIKRYQEQIEQNKDLHQDLHPDLQLNFDSLGLRFFNRYEFTLENSIELATGLMFYIGSTYSIRKPVKHGVHAVADTMANNTIEERYLDMNPYLRLVWTPRQYYYFQGKRKIYLQSHWPTFSFEIGNGIKNIMKSRCNYTRCELDVQQSLRIGTHRNLSWRCGGGIFAKQKEEYFVNYTYFSRSQYPTTWDRRSSGGAFALLDEYWYSSSPSYVQTHMMFESPFLLMHKWGKISKFIIKERIYCSNLWAQGKNPYSELGYGIGNNYFNFSVFCGLLGRHPFDVGVKFAFELDQHL